MVPPHVHFIPSLFCCYLFILHIPQSMQVETADHARLKIELSMNNYFKVFFCLFVLCVRACVCMCVRACVCMCVRLYICVSVFCSSLPPSLPPSLPSFPSPPPSLPPSLYPFTSICCVCTCTYTSRWKKATWSLKLRYLQFLTL